MQPENLIRKQVSNKALAHVYEYKLFPPAFGKKEYISCNKQNIAHLQNICNLSYMCISVHICIYVVNIWKARNDLKVLITCM